jgi:hypothetical protein
MTRLEELKQNRAMTDFLKFQRLCFLDAWRGSLNLANAWSGLWGPVLVWLASYWWGHPLKLPDQVDGYAVSLAFTFLGATWAGFLIVRFLAAPSKLYWSERQKTNVESDFRIGEHIHLESRPVKWPDGTTSNFYENSFFLPVGNKRLDGKTLRSSQVRIFFIGEPVLSRVKETGRTKIDIRHGEWALFEIGNLVYSKALGMVQGDAVVLTEEDRKSYERNIPSGYLSFKVRSWSGHPEYGLSSPFDKKPGTWHIIAVLSADDTIAKEVRLDIHLDLEKPSVSIER